MTYSPSQDPWTADAETTPVTDNSRRPIVMSGPGRRRFLIISSAAITIMVGVIAAVVMIFGSKDPTVHVISCSSDGIFTRVGYTITNNDRGDHDYYVEGTTGHSPTVPGVLKNVAGGETVSGTLMGTEHGDCRVTNVDQR